MRNFVEDNISSQALPLHSEWLISVRNPAVLWEEHWFAVTFEVFNLLLLYQVFKQAKKRGGDGHYLLVAAMFSTLCFELLPFIRPGYELWWYHQGVVNIFKKRVPSYVLSFYALTHYLSDSLTSKTNLPYLTRALLTAIFGVLIIYPFLWMAQRLLLVDYHFDDPVFKDRIVSVPVIQIFVFLLLFFHTSHLYHENVDALEPQERNPYNYIGCALQSGLVAAIYAIVEQYVLYLLFKLTLHLNTIFCVSFALSVLAFLAKGEMRSLQLTSISTAGVLQPLKRKELWAVVAGFIFLTTMPLWLNLQTLKSTGNRLQLGPCQINEEISNTSPLEVTRRRFLCPADTKNLPYDFTCMTQEEISFSVQNNEKNYTLCGKTMMNYFQVAQIMALYSIFGLFIIYNFMRLSFNFKIYQSPPVFAKKVL